MRYCRKIIKDEKLYIEDALEINNKIWNVKSTIKEFNSRVENGYLVGLFDSKELLGTISAVPLKYINIINNKYPTWDIVTANGTFNNAKKDADTLCCVAITNKFSKIVTIPNIEAKGRYKEWIEMLNNNHWRRNIELKEFINNSIELYLESNLDPVINFHKKDKLMIKGANVIKIFPDGRVEDCDSLGFNILMSYPVITKEIRKSVEFIKEVENINFDNIYSIGKSLIIGVFKEALSNKNIKYILPYSRPIKFKYYLTRVLYRISNNLNFESEKEKDFYKQILTLL